jgi:hypothetical protein
MMRSDPTAPMLGLAGWRSPTARPPPPAGIPAAVIPTWPRTAMESWSSAAVTDCSSVVATALDPLTMPATMPLVATLAGLLLGLWMLAPLGLGVVVLVGHLLARMLHARQAHRHPQQAAIRERTRHARRLAAEWPLLAQTLGLGYRDQWTRQNRFPAAEFVADDQGVTATVAAIAGAGLADYQRAAGYLADTCGYVSVRAEQQGPGLIRLRGLHRDPLLAPARVDLPDTTPASLDSWWLGWAEDGSLLMVRLAEVSGIVVAGLAGFGKTMLVAHFLGQLAPSPAVQFVLIDGRAAPTTTA